MPRVVPWVKVSLSLFTAFSWEGKLVDDNFKATRRNLLLGFENTTTLASSPQLEYDSLGQG